MLNIVVGWMALLLGIVAGIVAGLWFHSEEWLGGYSSWQRRLMRLGHISFFGLGFINLAFGLTVRSLSMEHDVGISAILLVIGVASMPTVCYGAAFFRPLRHLFAIPVLSVAGGIGIFIYRLVSL